MRIEFDRVDRGWFSIAGEAVRVPAIAGTASIEEEILSISFPQRSEIALIAEGLAFSYDGGDVVREFECQPFSTTGELKSLKRGCTIDAEDLKSCGFAAFRFDKTSKAKEPIKISDLPIRSPDSIWIGEGGKIEVSQNLVGKWISVHVAYPSPARASGQKLENLEINLVAQLGEEFVFYSAAPVFPLIGKCSCQRMLIDTSKAVIRRAVIDV